MLQQERTWVDLVLEYVKSGIVFGLIVVIISAILEAIATRGAGHDLE